MNILQDELRGMIDVPDVVLLKKFTYLSAGDLGTWLCPSLTMMNAGMRFLKEDSCGRTSPSHPYTIRQNTTS
jgi:hypothetical protein